jgi:hypothetical protein
LAARRRFRQHGIADSPHHDAVLFATRWRELCHGPLAAGVALLSGQLLKVAAPCASLLLIGFYAAMLRTYAAGAGIDCACFGLGDTIGPLILPRDGVLLCCSLMLAVLVFRSRGQRTLVRPTVEA